MALLRETWFYSSTGGTRWSEVYYRSRDSIANATFASNAAHLNRRLKLLSAHCSLQKIRYQTIIQPRAAKNVGYNLQGVDGVNTNPANYTEAAVINLVSAAGSRRLWLRGCAETAVRRSGTSGLDEPDDDFIKRLDAWFESLKSNGYLVLARKRANWLGDEPKRKKVEALVAGPTAGTIILTHVGEVVLGETKAVVIGGADARRFPGLNGVHDVIAQDGLEISVKYVLPDPAKIPGVGNMYLYRLEYKSLEDMSISHLACSFAYLGGRQTKKLDTGSRGSRRVLRRVQ